jgi:hypothetical protein
MRARAWSVLAGALKAVILFTKTREGRGWKLLLLSFTLDRVKRLIQRVSWRKRAKGLPLYMNLHSHWTLVDRGFAASLRPGNGGFLQRKRANLKKRMREIIF